MRRVLGLRFPDAPQPLPERFDELGPERLDPRAERAARQLLDQATPTVMLLPDGLLADLSDSSMLLGPETAWVDRLDRALRAEGLRARLVIAGSPGAAWALVHHGQEERIILSPNEDGRALAGLPPCALRLPASLTRTLAELGLRTIAALERLPRAGLAARFGQLVLERLDQALGRREERLRSWRPTPALRFQLELPHPLEDLDRLSFALGRLCDRMAEDLAARALSPRRLELLLLGEDGRRETRTVGYRQTLRGPGPQMREPLLLALREAALRFPVAALALEILETAPAEETQAGLFGETAAARDRLAVGRLLDRLAARLGPEALLRAHAVADHRPECAYRLEAWNHGSRAAPTDDDERPAFAPSRPTRLLDPPLPAPAPPGSGHPPQRLWLLGRWRELTDWSDVERIAAGAWDGSLCPRKGWVPLRTQREGAVQRDYRVARDAQGNRWWVYQEPGAPQGWFLHGVFA